MGGSHTKVSTMICDVKTETFTPPSTVADKAKFLNFTANGNKMVSDEFDLCAASALSLHALYTSNVTVKVIDKDATDHLGQEVVIATAPAATLVEIHKEIIRKMAVHHAVIEIEAAAPITSNDLKVMLKVMYEFGPSRS